jgi:hypothetical protein
MSSSCVQWRGEIGAYVVGALDGYARDRVTRHLAACVGCRADYDELFPVRDWLGVAALTAGRPEPSPVPTSYRGSADQPADTLRSSRSRTRRWLAAAGAGLAAVAAAVAIMVSSGASARAFHAADSATGVSGLARLHDTPTGTQIDLTTSGLHGHQQCILVAVTRGGTDIAGSWDATYDGSARITATTAFPANALTALRVESETGTLLLTIKL